MSSVKEIGIHESYTREPYFGGELIGYCIQKREGDSVTFTHVMEKDAAIDEALRLVTGEGFTWAWVSGLHSEAILKHSASL